MRTLVNLLNTVALILVIVVLQVVLLCLGERDEEGR